MAGFACCVAMSTCAPHPRTQLVVVVTSDMPVPSELDAIRIHVIDADGHDRSNFDVALTSFGSTALPVSFGVAPPSANPHAPVTVAIDAIRGGTTLFTARARTGFVEGRATRLDVPLSWLCGDHARQAACTSDQTCSRDGACVPVDVQATSLAEYVPGDSPPADGGGMPSPPRLVRPSSTFRITTNTPRFEWALGSGAEGAVVYVCRDRACTERVGAATQAHGTSIVWPTPLEPGVYFWHAVSVASGVALSVPSATWMFALSTHHEGLGASAQALLDYNGDGVTDLVAGEYGAHSAAGRVRLFDGARGGFASEPSRVIDGEAGQLFGFSIAPAGDIDGDGYSDLVIGTHGTGQGGAAWVYLGGPSGLSANPSDRLQAPAGSSGSFGSVVSAAGDVDGDGYGDLAIADPGFRTDTLATGRVYLYRGGPQGIAARPDITILDPSSATMSQTARFGGSLAPGDFDADGYSDLLVGAPMTDSRTGYAYLFRGATGAFATQPALTIMGPQTGDTYFGDAVESLGDVDGDGYPDAAVGAYGPGYLFVYTGGANALDATRVTRLSDLDTSTNFGDAVSGGGDLNGDGFDDFVVAGPSASSSTGYIALFLGGATLASEPVVTINGYAASSQFGQNLCLADVDGDGRPEVFAGAWLQDGDRGALYGYRTMHGVLETTPFFTLLGMEANAYLGAGLAMSMPSFVRTPRRWRGLDRNCGALRSGRAG